jgi:hypothetical protein
MEQKIPKSFKLTETCVKMLLWLAQKQGVNLTAVIELAIREMAVKHGYQPK